MPFSRARDWDAVAAIAAENLQHFLGLWAAEQLLEPRNIPEPQLRRLCALAAVTQGCLALHPVALLLQVQEALQAGRATTGADHQTAV
jgi:hypothetical protein